MTKTRRLRRSLLVLVLTAGCGTTANDSSSSSGGDAAAGDAGTSTADGSAASGATLLNDGYKRATWASNVTVSYGDCTLTYVSNGLPNHARDAEYALPNMGVMVPGSSTAHAATDPTVAQSYSFTINTCKTVGDSTATPLGNIGYMISGAGLFNPYEGDGATVALASNFSVKNTAGADVFFVDTCNGHPTPMGLYHYHGLPSCVTSQVDSAGGPSHIIGIAVDGYPIYGNRDIDGKEVVASQLDSCNGITSATPEFPAGVYHYVLLSTTDGSSAMRCTKGK